VAKRLWPQQQAFMAFAQGFAGNDQAGIERMDER
jgi:hypothetical protein